MPLGVFFVECGEVRIRADGEEIVVPRGQAFFSAPGPRQHWFAKNTRLLSVGFRSVWPDGRPLFRSGLNSTAKSSRLRLATLELFREVHRPKTSVTYREAVAATTHSMSGWAAHEAAWLVVFVETLEKRGFRPEPRAVPAGRRRVDHLIAWLNSRPLDQTTPTLPSGFALGMRRADQILQEHLGVSLREFMERRRLDAARERVAPGHGTLKEIAFELGFRHASHFTAWFRRHTGVSPSAYRAGGVEEA